MSDTTYMTPREVDSLFRWPRGRAKRLALRDAIEHIRLPDGDVRFERHVIDAILTPRTRTTSSTPQLRLVGNA